MNDCAAQLKHRLAAAGTWLAAPLLQRGLPYSAVRCEDELAELVITAQVEFNERLRSYRLCGTPLARKALQQLVQQEGQGAPTRMLGMMDKGGKAYRYGVAVRQTEPDGVMRYSMAEVEHELAPGAEGQVAHAVAVEAWVKTAWAAKP